MSFWGWLNGHHLEAASSRTPPVPSDPATAREHDRARFLAASKKPHAEPFEVAWKRFVDDQHMTAIQHYLGTYEFKGPGDKAALALTFGVDGRWIAKLEADAARVIAELRAGRPAQLQVSNEPMQSVFIYDDEGPGETVNELRRNRERDLLTWWRAEIERTKERILREAEQAKAEAQRQAAERQLQAERSAAEALEAERQRRLSMPIPLTMNNAGIVFGTRIKDGSDFVVPVRQVQHMLISGVSGAGKTTFMHQILYQLVRSAEVERLVLIDLKGGVSFYRYRHSGKVEVYYEMADVIRVIDELMPVMAERQRIMRESGVEHYRGGKIFVVIDEYAEIQTELDTADTKEAKATARRLAGNLASIARRARALGIVLICALQRPTVDAMDAAVRNNLSCRVCLRMATNQLAASMLDDLDRLSYGPTTLPTGRLYYYDASRGVTRYLQAHIAPGIDLGSNS